MIGASDIVVAFTFGDEVKFSLQTSDPTLTKQRHSAAADQLERLFNAYREGPRPILHKERLALAGIAYHDWARSFEAAPGEPEIWQLILEANNRAATSDQGLDGWFGATVDELLARKCIVTDADSRKALLREVARALNDAAKKLKKNAEGDYRPDEMAERFPHWEGAENHRQGGSTSLSIPDLFERWAREAEAGGRTAKTIGGYRSAILAFAGSLDHHDATQVSTADVIRWKDKRLSDGLSAKTIHGADLAALKSVFGWAERNALIQSNPAKSVSLRVGKKVKERPQGFTDKEAATLLSAAYYYQPSEGEYDETASAKRWAPWLCAYTGARIGEITQLRRKDFRQEGQRWVITITPEAGTVKNKEMREVPLHPHLLDLGLLDFVRSRPEGYLFVSAENNKPSSGRLQGVKNRVTEFARSVITDTRVAPNHAWRHRFISLCTDEGIQERVMNAICGHAAKTVAHRYGDVSLRAKAEAIERLPRIQVSGSPTLPSPRLLRAG